MTMTELEIYSPTRLDVTHQADSLGLVLLLLDRVAGHLLQQGPGLQEAEALLVVVDDDAEVLTDGSPPLVDCHHVWHQTLRAGPH